MLVDALDPFHTWKNFYLVIESVFHKEEDDDHVCFILKLDFHDDIFIKFLMVPLLVHPLD